MLKIYKNCNSLFAIVQRRFVRSLQEAAALGIPVVTTNVIGCKDAIIPNKTGLLCKVKNPLSLEKKIESLINSYKKRAIFAKNGREFAEKNFSLNNVLNKNLSKYNYLVSHEKKINFN